MNSQTKAIPILWKPAGPIGDKYHINKNIESIKYYDYIKKDSNFDTINFRQYHFEEAKLIRVDIESKYSEKDYSKIFIYDENGYLEFEYVQIGTKKQIKRKYKYDKNGNLTKDETYHLGLQSHGCRYLYNDENHLVSRITIDEFGNDKMKYTYILDKNGRKVSSLAYQDGREIRSSWKYNEDGKIICRKNSSSIEKFFYDTKGRKIRTTIKIGEGPINTNNIVYNEKGDIFYFDSYNPKIDKLNKTEYHYTYDRFDNIIEAIACKNNIEYTKYKYIIEYK